MNKPMLIALVVVALMLLAGCAPAPEGVEPIEREPINWWLILLGELIMALVLGTWAYAAEENKGSYDSARHAAYITAVGGAIITIDMLILALLLIVAGLKGGFS